MTIPFNIGAGSDASKTLLAPALGGGLKGASRANAPLSYEDLEREYCKAVGVAYPIIEMKFVRSWMTFRVRQNFDAGYSYELTLYHILQLSIILQGIAARYARRQASSANAKMQGEVFPVLGLLAKEIYQEGELAKPRL